ncbi:MAG TPA: FAD-dependent oxidoreductase [Tepidisphaeraceae bacterium]|jgi:thioredoxin reductase (NADPH)
MDATDDKRAFPRFSAEELASITQVATPQKFADGECLFRVGDAEVDMFVVLSGAIRVTNPTDGDREIIRHDGVGQFTGDIDLLTGRPVVVDAHACGETTVLRVSNAKVRTLLSTIPRVSEKLMVAFQVRRQLLEEAGPLGLRVIGDKTCRDTNVIREFLAKNFMPFTWLDTDTPAGRAAFEEAGSPKITPVVQCNGTQMLCPPLRDVAECAGVWRPCPTETVDIAIVGGGPAGLAAAVYGASEGLKTIVLDRVGPGGQAGGSSRIENFIGFPAGLSGADLATRGVLQMLKFGAMMLAPVKVEALEPGDANTPHGLKLDCGATLRAHHVLIATGATWRKLPAKNADRYERAGIYYACTATESRLHSGQEIAVVGGGNSAGQAAMYLAENCARHVHLLVRGESLTDTMSQYLCGRISANKRITLRPHVEIDEVIGDHEIASIKLKYNHDQDGPEGLDVGAIFVFVGAEPHTGWLPPEVARNEKGYIRTGADLTCRGLWPIKERDPCDLETSVPGVLALGDVRAGSTKRVGFAVGDGSMAITCVHRLRSYVGG